MAGSNPDLVIRVAANIAALQTDMAAAVATLKSIDGAAASTAASTANLASSTDTLGSSWVARIAEGQLLRDAIRSVLSVIEELAVGIPEEAHQLAILSLQTRISVEDLQVITAATREYGVEGDQLGRALFQLQQRIAGGDANVTTAYHLMGLSIEEVKGKNAVDLFLTTEKGLSTLSGAIQDTAAKDLYGGRLGSSMIAFASGVDDAMEKAKSLNTIASEDSVKAAAAYAEAIDRATHSIHAWFMEMEGGSAQGFNVINDALDKGAGKWNIFVAMVQDFATSSVSGGANATHLATLLDNLSTSAGTSAAAHAKLTAQAQALAAAGGPLADGMSVQLGLHTQIVAALTDEEKAAKFMAATEADSGKALLDWQEQDLDHLKEIGLLTSQNAAAIGVNADQLKRYEAGLAATKAASEALQKASDATWEAMLAKQKLEEAEILAVTKLWAEYDEIVGSGSGSAYDRAGAAIDKWYADTVATHVKAKTDTAEFYAAVSALDDAKWAHLTANELASTAGTKEAAQQAATIAQGQYDFAIAHSDSFRQSAIEALRLTAQAAKDAADQWSATLDPAIDGATTKVIGLTVAAAAMQSQFAGPQAGTGLANGGLTSFEIQARNLAQMVGAGVNYSPAAFGGLPTHAAGGPTIEGPAYLHDSEYVVPKDGALVMSGGGSPIHIYITSPLGTPSAIAAAVDQALMARQRNTGQRMPVSN